MKITNAQKHEFSPGAISARGTKTRSLGMVWDTMRETMTLGSSRNTVLTGGGKAIKLGELVRVEFSLNSHVECRARGRAQPSRLDQLLKNHAEKSKNEVMRVSNTYILT